jgi:hypothetical protein
MSQITFVCCVESGYLESQTTRLIYSLRKFGGRFAAAPLIAVTPRFGPPISKATQRLFTDLGVRYIRSSQSHPYSWFNFYNKPLALVAAEPHVETEAVGFLDSDLLIVNEPEELVLSHSEDFLACPVDIKEMGTAGPGDLFEGLWRAACAVINIDIDALPWVMTCQTQERVRLYFNGGLFVYRKSSGFAKEYLRICRALLDSRIGTNAEGYGLGFKEMVSVGFAAITLSLRCRTLPFTHNYPMLGQAQNDAFVAEDLRAARIVHYHNSMWPPFWETFQSRMRQSHPNVAVWLASCGPMRNNAPPHFRALTSCLRMLRRRRADRYLSEALNFR